MMYTSMRYYVEVFVWRGWIDGGGLRSKREVHDEKIEERPDVQTAYEGEGLWLCRIARVAALLHPPSD